MNNLIKLSAVWPLMVRTDNNAPVPFNFCYAKSDGDLKWYEGAVLSSIHSTGKTFNVLLPGELKPKSFRKILLTQFNDLKVYI